MQDLTLLKPVFRIHSKFLILLFYLENSLPEYLGIPWFHSLNWWLYPRCVSSKWVKWTWELPRKQTTETQTSAQKEIHAGWSHSRSPHLRANVWNIYPQKESTQTHIFPPKASSCKQQKMHPKNGAKKTSLFHVRDLFERTNKPWLPKGSEVLPLDNPCRLWRHVATFQGPPTSDDEPLRVVVAWRIIPWPTKVVFSHG